MATESTPKSPLEQHETNSKKEEEDDEAEEEEKEEKEEEKEEEKKEEVGEDKNVSLGCFPDVEQQQHLRQL